MAAGENRFVRELNEKDVIELLENATVTPGSVLVKAKLNPSLDNLQIN